MARSIGLTLLDGSPTAECVLPWATALACGLEMEMTLLRLAPEAWPGGDERAERALSAARHYLDGVTSELQACGAPISARVAPVGHDIAAGINGAAEELNADLIMIATHGRTGPRRWVMGSVADAVVRTATRPVLVIRGDLKHTPKTPPVIRRVMVPVDGSKQAEAAIPHAGRLAAKLGATLDLVQVVPYAATLLASSTEVYLPEGIDEQMEKGAEGYLDRLVALAPGVAVETSVERGSAAEVIIDHAETTHADLIVMTTHGRTGLTRWALGSVADRVLRAGNRPVLLVRGQSD